MKPPIGVPRCCPGPECGVVYPGEVATARVSNDDLQAAINAALDDDGSFTVAVTDWLVEPDPSWHGWWLRVRYRIWGRWFSKGPPRLEISASIGETTVHQ